MYLLVPKVFIEVRHGEGLHQIHPVGECPVSNMEAPLTDRGREQAACTGRYLRKRFERIDEVFTSMYVRAQQTTGEIFPGYPPHVDDRLNELWHGVLHRCSKAEQREKYPAEIERRERDGWFRCKPLEGESCEEKLEDLRSFHKTLRRRYAGKVVLAVYHANAILLSGYLLQGLSIEEVEHRNERRVCPNASVTVYEGRGDKLILVDEFLVPQ